MISRWITVVLCFVMFIGVSASLGCTAERNRYRANSIGDDLDHMVDDVDWALGLDERSMVYEDTFPPHP